MKKLILYFMTVMVSTFTIPAQEVGDSLRIFKLGEVQISGERKYPGTIEISGDVIRGKSRVNIAEILSEIPGVVFQQEGSRNEATVLLRGFDSRQVPLLIDGIPVYIAYDGNIDLGRFLSWDYEKIVVSRGYTSLLYGPNTMGGALNLVTRKPTGKFEFDLYSGISGSNEGLEGGFGNYRLGGNVGHFFYQLNLSHFYTRGWGLSENFDQVSMQAPGMRDNSGEKDLSGSFRVGYANKRKDEYVLTYHRQDGEKGIPVYDGENQQQRFWKMPDWDKEGFYFNSKTHISKNSEISGRIYLEKYYNFLRSFDDSSYTSQTLRYAFNSKYDDLSIGTGLIYNYSGIQNMKFSSGLQLKRDSHNEKGSDTSPFIGFVDNLASFSVENEWQVSKEIRMVTGVSWNFIENAKAEEYFSITDSVGSMPSGQNHRFNMRTGITYQPGRMNSFWFSFAENSRFATLKERYSYRLGRSLPNPDLKAENAAHLIAGYRLNIQLIQISVEAYYIMTGNKIAYTNVEPGILQYRNIEKSLSTGFDSQLDIRPSENYSLGFNYSFIKIKNPDDPDFYFIYIPRHTFRASLNGKIGEPFKGGLSYSYLSERHSYTDGSFPVEGYGKIDLFLNCELTKGLVITASANNLLDKAYFYSEGYPAQGRNFRIGLRYSIKKD